ncbi:MAG: hypothetical protein JM57_11600 [Comamonadaceae bacterium BICA1-1]|nr:MAG: hypothetical protein JM57_11600 [Comamonadaceae bacterium BICA1-1]
MLAHTRSANGAATSKANTAAARRRSSLASSQPLEAGVGFWAAALMVLGSGVGDMCLRLRR